MATATPTHGSKAVLSIGGVQYADHLIGSFANEQNYATVDTTSFGATAMTNIPSPIQENKPIALQLMLDPTVHNALVALEGVAGTALVYGPIGSTTGNPKCTYAGTVTKYGLATDLAGKGIINLEYTPSGAGAWTVY